MRQKRTFLPVSIMSSASGSGSILRRRCVPPAPGRRPSITSGCENTVRRSFTASRYWQAIASCASESNGGCVTKTHMHNWRELLKLRVNKKKNHSTSLPPPRHEPMIAATTGLLLASIASIAACPFFASAVTLSAVFCDASMLEI